MLNLFGGSFMTAPLRSDHGGTNYMLMRVRFYTGEILPLWADERGKAVHRVTLGKYRIN
jgi:hypothetical protein